MRPEGFQDSFGVSRETLSRLKIYAELLVKWQKAVNLVGPNTLDDVWARHFADSAQLDGFVPKKALLADLGSGAGFPGLVLAIMRPDLNAHLIESDGRKVEFLRTVSRETDTPIVIHNERAERVLGVVEPDLIAARAFAPAIKIMQLLSETGVSAKLLLLKGKEWRAELSEARQIYDFRAENAASLTDRNARIVMIEDVRPQG